MIPQHPTLRLPSSSENLVATIEEVHALFTAPHFCIFRHKSSTQSGAKPGAKSGANGPEETEIDYSGRQSNG
jgi:hypothetical protein